MPLTFTSTQAGSSTDYLSYLTANPVKTDRYMDSDLLDFKLYVGNSGFVRLNRGAYIALNTVTYGTWFSGYITSSPTLEYLGVDSAGKPAWAYTYQATADDYILNLQPLGFLPNYMNVYMGDIIKSLVNILAPGMFDVSNIGNGQFVAQYSVTPQTFFRDVLKDLCQASSYVFYSKNHSLYFVQQDSLPVSLTIDWNNKHFTPSELSLKASAVAVVNQAFVLGELEPQTYINSYFLGDGFTGSFPLISDVFGVDRFTLIQEDFSGSSVNTNTWNIYDPAGSNLQLVNGYLNCVGGTGGSAYDTNLQSLYPIPLEGNIRFTHGEWDFLETVTTSANFGVVCGVWTTTTPTSSLSGCLYGLMDRYVSSAHILNPIVNGSLDTTQSVSIDNTKRYVIRTLAAFGRLNRVKNSYTYTNNLGVVNTVSLTADADSVSWQTTIIEIDPITGLVTNTAIFSNIDNTLTNTQLFATYIPVASANIHATVTGITVSIPLQAYLEHEGPGEVDYTSQLIGPNEIDSLDNTAPVATIVQGSSNTNTRSSVSGKPTYNTGQASLTYFKDSTTLVATTPQVGTSIHLGYRAAGYALGKSSDNASILTESQSWGDSGIRSMVKTDMAPRPRTSEECEAAAASIVGDNSYQHYEGTYNVYSTYVDHEPVAGSILPFSNVPATVPTIKAEEINQVTTTLVSAHPVELFQHQITFGKPDSVRKLVHDFYQPPGVFLPSDASSSPYGVDTAKVGAAFTDDVIAPSFTGYDTDNLYYDTNQAFPSGGGFEVRYTDDGWGVDDGKNLITRVTVGTTFSVPRNTRSKVVFIKGHDVRNKIQYSEDFTQTVWNVSGASITKALGKNPNGHTSHLSTIVFASGGQAYQALSYAQTGVFSISVKGTVGKTLRVQIVNGGTVISFKDVSMNGGWQRVSLYGVAVAAVQVVSVGMTQTVQATFASFENTTTETQYCKTKSGYWGAYSRYSSAVHVAYPLTPNSPTAVVDTTDPGAFVITIVPPILAADTWGLELRSAPGYGTGAMAGTVTRASSVVTAIAVAAGGREYEYPPLVVISGGGGTGATADAVLTGKAVTGFTITDGGTGYTSSPDINLYPSVYKSLYRQDIVSAPGPYTFTDTTPVKPYQYFPFSYNLLKEYSLPGLVEGEQTIPLNIVPSPGKVTVYPDSSGSEPLYGVTTGSSYIPSTFIARVDYDSAADSVVLPTLSVSSVIPVTSYSSIEAPPVMEDLVVQVDIVSGKLVGGHTYYVCCCGVDASGFWTPVSKMISVYVDDSLNNVKLVIPKITIPDPSSMVSGLIFIAQDNPQTLAVAGTFALPMVITPNPTGDLSIVTEITSGVVYQMPGFNARCAPAPSLDVIRVKVKEVIHAGLAGATVTDISSFHITCADLIDTSSTPDSWTNYTVSIITNAAGVNKRFNFGVFAFDPTTGTFTTSSMGVDPATKVAVGDILVIRAKAAIGTSTTIGNAKFSNATNSHAGLTSVEVGYLVRIIAGAGMGQRRKIESHTTDTYTVSEPWDTIPDITSTFIVEGYEWQYQVDSSTSIVNSDPGGASTIRIPLDNYHNVVMLIMEQTVTTSGVESPEELSPIGELYMFGDIGSSTTSVYQAQLLL